MPFFLSHSEPKRDHHFIKQSQWSSPWHTLGILSWKIVPINPRMSRTLLSWTSAWVKLWAQSDEKSWNWLSFCLIALVVICSRFRYAILQDLLRIKHVQALTITIIIIKTHIEYHDVGPQKQLADRVNLTNFDCGIEKELLCWSGKDEKPRTYGVSNAT